MMRMIRMIRMIRMTRMIIWLSWSSWSSPGIDLHPFLRHACLENGFVRQHSFRLRSIQSCLPSQALCFPLCLWRQRQIYIWHRPLRPGMLMLHNWCDIAQAYQAASGRLFAKMCMTLWQKKHLSQHIGLMVILICLQLSLQPRIMLTDCVVDVVNFAKCRWIDVVITCWHIEELFWVGVLCQDIVNVKHKKNESSYIRFGVHSKVNAKASFDFKLQYAWQWWIWFWWPQRAELQGHTGFFFSGICWCWR